MHGHSRQGGPTGAVTRERRRAVAAARAEIAQRMGDGRWPAPPLSKLRGASLPSPPSQAKDGADGAARVHARGSYNAHGERRAGGADTKAPSGRQ